MEIKVSGYYWLDSWIMANIIQLATQEFCSNYLNYKNDPCGRQYDQMTQAARSGQANIAEGNSRHNTSRETEMKLTDVARASFSELASDYFNWLIKNGVAPWSNKSEEFKIVSYIQLDRPTYKDDVQHLSALHILTQKSKYSEWLSSTDSIKTANCILILCNRTILMLNKQLQYQLESFKQEGGFSETLTAERLSFKVQQEQQTGAPTCPKCGKPMIKRICKRGGNIGNSFWSCSAYPECNGSRKC
ncbi:MAG: four helix bundle suffix domain-containing protein [Bacteroidales bacterium]|nr:four helix bundle suffix domain-containing protein [Bacteroidales bacterium]